MKLISKLLITSTIALSVAFVGMHSLNIRLPVTISQLFYKDYAAKKERWQEMEQKVASWADGLGKGIDEGIKDMVIVLNLLGFETRQSCEGHIAWGRAYPWVSFNTDDDVIKKFEEEWRLLARAVEEKAKSDESSSELDELYKKRNDLYFKIDRMRMMKLVPINDLIKDFYKTQCPDPDRMIAWGRIADIIILGGEWQITRDEATKLQKLKEYQQVMRAFTDFLIDYYYKK